MTKDEFINFDMDDSMVVLTGDLARVTGEMLLVKRPGQTDGGLASPEDYADFVPGFGHAYADGPIMRYFREVGDISMIASVLDRQESK